jgi:hypothetical protein
MQVAHKGKESYQNRFNVYALNRKKIPIPRTVHEWFQIDLCPLNMEAVDDADLGPRPAAGHDLRP